MGELFSEDEFLSKAVNVPLQALHWEPAQKQGIEVLVRRDDLIDEHLSGNKFYKLFYNLQSAKAGGFNRLLSFGGAYSNHLYALAAAGHRFGFKTIGVVRGERPRDLSPTLRDAERWGMLLHFVSRAEYREKGSAELLHALGQKFGDFYAIPEGGANLYGAKGAGVMGWAINQQLQSDFSAVCLASGTGNTLAGLSAGLNAEDSVLGFSVLKGEGDLALQVISQLKSLGCNFSNWRVISGYHGGGYGKKLPDNIRSFGAQFERDLGVRLDPVYTLKLFWGVANLMQQNYWPRASRLVLVHTGGLQGCRGFR